MLIYLYLGAGFLSGVILTRAFYKLKIRRLRKRMAKEIKSNIISFRGEEQV